MEEPEIDREKELALNGRMQEWLDEGSEDPHETCGEWIARTSPELMPTLEAISARSRAYRASQGLPEFDDDDIPRR